METGETIHDKEPYRPPKILANYLVSALDIEDEISNGIYLDYLNPKNWPGTISPEVFRKIATRLTVLIDDTKKHRKIIEALIKDHG
jgi:hypothetical protein